MTSNKNLSNTINMKDKIDDKLIFLQKRKTLYENKIFGFLKDVIKSRKSLRTAEQNYNKKQTKANKNKFDDKKLDYEENVENFTEYKNNYTGIMYQYFNELFDKWDVNQILSFIKKNSFDKIKNEISKVRQKLFSLSDKAALLRNKAELNQIAEESKPLHENMNEWINLRNFYQNLLLDFENEFYKARSKEFEHQRKVTKEKRKQSLKTARDVKRELNRKVKYECEAMLFKRIEKEEYVNTEGKSKSSIVKRQHPEEYFKLLFSKRIYYVTAVVKDDFRIKKDNDFDKPGRVYDDSANWNNINDIMATDHWFKTAVYKNITVFGYLSLILFFFY